MKRRHSLLPASGSTSFITTTVVNFFPLLDKNLSVRKVEQLVKDFYVVRKTETGKKSFTFSSKTASANLNDVEDKLRKIFGTKISCKQRKNGSGEIVIEYYSSTELDRLFELFEIIDKNYN